MFTAVRTMLLGLLVAAALVLGVASAGAVNPNLVANPGFETACGSVPCNWNASSSGTITRDTVNPHTGAASIAVAGNGAFTVFDSFSDCFLVAPSTTYTVQGWYRAAPTSLMTSLTLALLAYSNTSCGQQLVSGDGPIVASPVKTDTWTFVTGQVTTGANVGSARLLLRGGCGANKCTNTATLNYDDVEVVSITLAVTVSSFSAHRAGKGVLLRWRTGTEANELGFNVYRQQGARRVRVNRRLLPALGGIGGSSYSYRDRRAPRHRALRYWLQDVAVDGTRTWHGPVRVSGA